MAASDALSVDGGSGAAGAEAAPKSSAAAPRLPQLLPAAQLVAVVVGVLTIIWYQQQTTDSLRTELRAEITEVRAEITEVRAEIGELRTELRAEIGELRAAVSENGQRLARVEGFLGIGIPEAVPETPAPHESGNAPQSALEQPP